MRILIDGYNLIRCIPELKNAEGAGLDVGRESLLENLAAYRIGRGHRVTIVFDGTYSLHLGGGMEKVYGINVRFSPRGSDADRLIRESLSKNEADVLVSADRELTSEAVRNGVTAVSPGLFWDKGQEEIYRRLKGEEDQGERRKTQGGRRLSKTQKRDRQRIEKL